MAGGPVRRLTAAPRGATIAGPREPPCQAGAVCKPSRNLSSLPSTSRLVINNRPFVTIGEMNNVLGADLSEEELEELYGHLFVPINLNEASNSDIQLIPGVGGRMAHEFEEYRPYSNMEQFRREIGKYVDEAEVARLEQYVTLD